MKKVFYIFLMVTITQSLPFDNDRYAIGGTNRLKPFETDRNQSYHTVGFVQTLFGANITLHSEPVSENYSSEFIPSEIATSLLDHTNEMNPTKREALPNSPLLKERIAVIPPRTTGTILGNSHNPIKRELSPKSPLQEGRKNIDAHVITSLIGDPEQKKKIPIYPPGILGTLLGPIHNPIKRELSPKSLVPKCHKNIDAHVVTSLIGDPEQKKKTAVTPPRIVGTLLAHSHNPAKRDVSPDSPLPESHKNINAHVVTSLIGEPGQKKKIPIYPPGISGTLLGHTHHPSKRAASPVSPLPQSNKGFGARISTLRGEQKETMPVNPPKVKATLLGDSHEKVSNKEKTTTVLKISSNLEPPLEKKIK